MSGDKTNSGRRRFLTAATTVVGAVGTGYLLVPFISSMQPSAKARAAGAPVRADVSKLEPGQMIRVKWRGKPVWLVRRTEKMLETLPALVDTLRDPESLESEQPPYAQNDTGLMPVPLIWAQTGKEASSAPVMVPNLTLPDVSTSRCLHQRIW
jgi:ubiquinol-cytochrome c reductase iron-sulfur subunit